MIEIEKYNQKWLKYMNSVDVSIIMRCPNGHLLIAYIATKVSETEIVIACPYGGIGTGVDTCDYYDYNSFKVSINTPLSISVKRW